MTAVGIGWVLTPTSYADSSTPGKVIAGWVEKITFESVDEPIKAKLDSGAKTSSVHAEDIERFQRDDDEWVRFEIVLEDEHDNVHRVEMERPVTRNVRIKDEERRAVVELDFCFDGRKREAEFTLADRSEYLYSVLIGRSFLEGTAVIDVEQTFLTQAHCVQDG